jgi:hypothetical protein
MALSHEGHGDLLQLRWLNCACVSYFTDLGLRRLHSLLQWMEAIMRSGLVELVIGIAVALAVTAAAIGAIDAAVDYYLIGHSTTGLR